MGTFQLLCLKNIMCNASPGRSQRADGGSTSLLDCAKGLDSKTRQDEQLPHIPRAPAGSSYARLGTTALDLSGAVT